MLNNTNVHLYFFKDCKDRFYGNTRDCEGNCGHCLANKLCNKETGYCPGGCEPNFLGPLCQGIFEQIIII